MTTITLLPADNFDVYIENEIDELKLLWLVNIIGEKKLRLSASKKNRNYPECKLFVSALLKRFNLKVPTHIYAAVKIPIYWVYVLVLKDSSALKIGVTGSWPDRAYAFVRTSDYSGDFNQEINCLFNINESLAFKVDFKPKALQIEKTLKRLFAEYRVESPYRRGLIPFGCGGHTEWFSLSIYAHLVDALSVNVGGVTLANSLDWSFINVLKEIPEGGLDSNFDRHR
jgi:hypothetical protein